MIQKSKYASAACSNAASKFLSEDTVGISVDEKSVGISDGCSSSVNSHISSGITVTAFLRDVDPVVALTRASRVHHTLSCEQAATITRVRKLENENDYEFLFAGDGFWGYSLDKDEFILIKESFVGAELPLYPHYWINLEDSLAKINDKFEEPKYSVTSYTFTKTNTGEYLLAHTKEDIFDVNHTYLDGLIKPFTIRTNMGFIASDGLDKVQNYLTSKMLTLGEVLTIVDPLGYKAGDVSYAERRIKVLQRRNCRFLDDISLGFISH